MSEALERIISDAEITKHHFGNWPVMTPREVVNEGVLKYAHGFSSGHTQLQILLSHKLLKKPKPGSYRADLSEKGKKYARALYARRAEAAEAALASAYMAALDDAAKKAEDRYILCERDNVGQCFLRKCAVGNVLRALPVPADLAKRLGVGHE